ncbi:MAG: ABC transporter permease [Dehalococcoidia bacterium]|nr:MAG: ABC transporter permease [Dehalococcoidia bacterium]
MNFGVIRALVAKDFTLFFRNRFYALITILGIITYLVIYFVMPSLVNEELEIGLYAPIIPPVFELIQQEEGLEFHEYNSDQNLRQAITDRVHEAGVVLPEDIMEQLASGQTPPVTLYFSIDAPDEIKDIVETMVKEMAYLQTGQFLAIDISAEILGPDLLGDQIPIRDRMRLMLVIMLIMFEMMGLASLISEEVEQGTIRALLVTPMSVRDLFTAKLIMGASLAFIQGALFMTIVGGLNIQPSIILIGLLLGSIMFTGTGFLIASLAKDMLTSMGWGITAILIYAIPAFGVMFPGTVTDWARFIPTYYLTNIIHQVSNLNAGWSEIWLDLLILMVFNILLVWGGIMAIGRKLR